MPARAAKPPKKSTRKPATAKGRSARARTKSAGESAAVATKRAETPALIEQPHGGALLAGGVPGNAGGGRPRNAIRDRLASIVDEDGVDFIRGVVRGEVVTRLVQKCEHCGKEPTKQTAEELLKSVPAVTDRVAAFDKAARYGIGTTKEITVDHVTGRLEETYAILLAHLDADTFARVDAELTKVWR